jgi:tRNA A37 threonylcarbamoyltransferase TsaD
MSLLASNEGRALSQSRCGVEVAMTDETPSVFEVALAEAIIVVSGGVCVSQYLADALADANARRHAGLAVTDAELAWIESSLIASPGYSQWVAKRLLDKTLRLEKAFV